MIGGNGLRRHQGDIETFMRASKRRRQPGGAAAQHDRPIGYFALHGVDPRPIFSLAAITLRQKVRCNPAHGMICVAR